MAVEALSFHIKGMMEDGEAIPEASTLDALAKDPAMKGAVAFLVNVDIAEKAGDLTSRRARVRWRRSIGAQRIKA